MKKTWILMVIGMVLSFGITAFAEDLYDLSIEMQIGANQAVVDGVVTPIDENEQVVPFIENDRTLVPLRFIAEHLDLTVEWNQETQLVTLCDAQTEIIVAIDKTEAKLNGTTYTLDCGPMIKHDRTFVPVRFISEALQCDVTWDGAAQTVLVRRELETELDINDAEVQKLFSDVLEQNEFASYYVGYCDSTALDNPNNVFSGTMRQLFALLKFNNLVEKHYTKDEAAAEIQEFLSHGDTSKSLSSYGIDQLGNGANYGSGSAYQSLVGVYDGKLFDDISVDLFGIPLSVKDNLVYAISYHTFFLFNRVNLFYPYSQMIPYNVFYNQASNQYLFTKYADTFRAFDLEGAEAIKSETTLVKATKHNGKISLYMERTAEVEEYSGGKSTYQGLYKNTYQKGDNGYFWVRSYGKDYEMTE